METVFICRTGSNALCGKKVPGCVGQPATVAMLHHMPMSVYKFC